MSYTKNLEKGISIAREELRKHGKILSYTSTGWIITDDRHVKKIVGKKIDSLSQEVEVIESYYELDRA